MRPRDLVEAVERTLKGPFGIEHHVDELLDNFYRADPTGRQAMIEGEPRLVEDAFADAFVGGVGEHLARRWGLSVPGWVRDERRYLKAAVFHPDIPGHRRWMMAVAPVAFRVRLIFTGPEPLQRARFPYDGEVAVLSDGGAFENLAWSQRPTGAPRPNRADHPHP